MANREGRCVICGKGPTIKAHLFPRALIHDIRRDEKNVVEGSRFRKGVLLRQNGQWDDSILCYEHEIQGGLGDDYTIELLRYAKNSKLGKTDYGATILPNPKPELLVHFAYACIWRFAVARGNDKMKKRLGPYEKRIRNILFNDATPDIEVVIWKRSYHIGHSSPTDVAVMPYRTKLKDWNIWTFVIGGMGFFIKTDSRPFPTDWKPFIANDQRSLIYAENPSVDFRTVPAYQTTLQSMMTRR